MSKKLPELPDQYEAAAHIFPCDLEDLKTGEKTHEVCSIPVGSPTHGKSVPLFAEDQMRAYGQACWDAALEAAAKVCDSRADKNEGAAAFAIIEKGDSASTEYLRAAAWQIGVCASAIRSMKGSTQ